MELDYELTGLYSYRKLNMEKVNALISELIDDNYVEEQEVIDAAKKYNSVIMIEVNQDDGYSETILVDNKGVIQEKIIYDPLKVSEMKAKLKGQELGQVFDEETCIKAKEHMAEHNIKEEEFISEYLDELVLDLYYVHKEETLARIKEYYVSGK